MTAKLAQVQATMATALLKTIAPGESPMSLSTPKATMTVAKNRATGFANTSVESVYGKMDLPTNLAVTGSANVIVQQQVGKRF